MADTGTLETGRRPGSVSVGAVSDIGPRQVNEDRMFTALSDSGVWVIAVADGLGGHPRGDEAAQAAVEGLPERISSLAEMTAVFADANERVVALRSRKQRRRSVRLFELPMSTLCVAAWTPEGGLLIGLMGDTLPFIVKSEPGGFAMYGCGQPQRDSFGSIVACLGLSDEHAASGLVTVEVDMTTDAEVLGLPDGVVIASDGAWEPFAIYYDDAEWLFDGSPTGIGSAPAPGADHASGIARTVLARARSLGLKDNATVTVAHWR